MQINTFHFKYSRKNSTIGQIFRRLQIPRLRCHNMTRSRTRNRSKSNTTKRHRDLIRRIPFTLNGHPQHQALKHIYLTNFKLLQGHPDTDKKKSFLLQARSKPKNNQVLLNARARYVTPVLSSKTLLTSRVQNTESRLPI